MCFACDKRLIIWWIQVIRQWYWSITQAQIKQVYYIFMYTSKIPFSIRIANLIIKKAYNIIVIFLNIIYFETFTFFNILPKIWNLWDNISKENLENIFWQKSSKNIWSKKYLEASSKRGGGEEEEDHMSKIG